MAYQLVPPPAILVPKMPLVELGRYPFAMQAEIARTFLESHGIGALVFDSGMNIADSSAIAIPVRLMVLDEDRDEAKDLLEQADIA
jgi:Putative prokaryotic signal transducing protein